MLPQELVFELHKSKILNSNKKLHYQAHGKIVRFLRELSFQTGKELKDAEGVYFDKFKVVVTVMPPTRRRMDPANLWPTAKAIVDGLTDAEWWADDDFKHLLEISFRYGGLSGERDTFKVRVVVQELTEAEVAEYHLDSEVVG